MRRGSLGQESKQENVGDFDNNETESKKYNNITRFNGHCHGRGRASTLPTELPCFSKYDKTLIVKSEVSLKLFRKKRRGGICPNNVDEYYRSWETRSKSI